MYLRKRIRIVLAMALAMLGLVLCMPAPALAAEEMTHLQQLQQEVERTSEEYNAALARLDEINAEIEGIQGLIDELEQQIPVQKEHTAAAISRQYKLQQDTPSLLLLLFSAEDFNSFVTTLSYLDSVSKRSSSAVEELVAMEDELKVARGELEETKVVAEQKVAEASEALEAAKQARKDVQQAALARAAAEAAAAQAAVQAAQTAQAHQEEYISPTSGEATPIVAPSANSPSAIDWTSDKASFVAEWAPRIDAYLGSAPLGGYGTTFAEAAWDYGVDPRWSPAISCIESSKGRNCFRLHNAWGWGDVDWESWDVAIREHVAGLSRGYGYTISIANAQKYCPPTWQSWYSLVLSEMERI